MLDALVYPFVEGLKSAGAKGSREVLRAAVQEADRGVAATQNEATIRAIELSPRLLGQPDSGARAVGIWLSAIVESLYA